jgi:hypothetical protein
MGLDNTTPDVEAWNEMNEEYNTLKQNGGTKEELSLLCKTLQQKNGICMRTGEIFKRGQYGYNN